MRFVTPKVAPSLHTSRAHILKTRARETKRMGGGGNITIDDDDDDDDDETVLDQINNTGNPIVDEVLNDTKTTVLEMEKWIANKTNASEEVVGEIASAIKDIATTGHFGVNGTNATVPVVQDALVGKEEEQQEEKLEILRNVPEFRYRSEAALGGNDDGVVAAGISGTTRATMLLQNVNAYERKDYFVFGTLSMAFCVAFFCAVVLRKHAQKCTASSAKRSGEEEGEKTIAADRGDAGGDLEKASLMRSIVGKIKYGSVV